MKSFFFVIYDDTQKTQDIIGPMQDDTIATENIVKMQEAGFEVRCQAWHGSLLEWERDKIPHYAIEKYLQMRLSNEYENKTGQRLNGW